MEKDEEGSCLGGLREKLAVGASPLPTGWNSVPQVALTTQEARKCGRAEFPGGKREPFRPTSKSLFQGKQIERLSDLSEETEQVGYRASPRTCSSETSSLSPPPSSDPQQ